MSGVLPAPIDGRHDPFVAVPRYLEILERRLTGGDLKSARSGKYVVDTALADLELKQRRGELVAREAIEKEWFRVARTTRDNLFNLPDRVAAQCASMREQSNVHALLMTEIRQCVESLAGEIVRPAAPPRQ